MVKRFMDKNIIIGKQKLLYTRDFKVARGS